MDPNSAADRYVRLLREKEEKIRKLEEKSCELDEEETSTQNDLTHGMEECSVARCLSQDENARR